MRLQSLPLVLPGLNLVLLVWLLMANSGAAFGQTGATVVRASAYELVHEAGVVRAQLISAPGGETLLRMRDANGDGRVKLGASEEGSGLLLGDQTAQPGLRVPAKRGSTTLSLTDTSGAQR